MISKATQIELVHGALHNALEVIGLAFKPDGKEFCSPCDDIDDEKIKDYYYDINEMCIELADRKAMDWQKNDK